MPTKKSESVPKTIEPAYRAIVDLTDAVCRQHLNGEYATLARQLTAALGRKRPSPLLSGKPGSWACGILYALGTVNFLFDKNSKPFMKAEDLCAAFGLSKSTGANKSKQIRDLFGMSQLDPDWTLPSKLDSNPLVWMLEINGLIRDIRSMPREVQEQAFDQGFIPYIPADRKP